MIKHAGTLAWGWKSWDLPVHCYSEYEEIAKHDYNNLHKVNFWCLNTTLISNYFYVYAKRYCAVWIKTTFTKPKTKVFYTLRLKDCPWHCHWSDGPKLDEFSWRNKYFIFTLPSEQIAPLQGAWWTQHCMIHIKGFLIHVLTL